MSDPDDSPAWLITGCSTGFGRELARVVLAHGGRVAVTAREVDRVADLAEDADGRALPLALDVTDADQIRIAVQAAEARFGGIDVLVNNAGYGYQASIEEGEDAEIRAQFEANVFGLFALTRAVLPGMRERRRGHVISITSVAGLVGFQGSGYFLTDARMHRGTSGAAVVMRTVGENSPFPWKLLGIHSARMDVGGRDVQLDESLGLNCAWYADILLTLTT